MTRPDHITILGATGRIGRIVARTLFARGHGVRVIVRAPGRWHGPETDVAIAALDDAHALAAALQGTDAVFAILPDDVTAPDFVENRRRMIDALTASVRSTAVAHVVFISSVLAPLDVGLARELHAAERALADTGCLLTVLRCAFFHENVLSHVAAARDHGVSINLFGDPDAPIPMVAVADIAAAAVDALEHPPRTNEIVDVVGPYVAPAQVASLLGAALGRSLNIVTIPASERANAMRGAGLPSIFAEQLADMFAAYADGRLVLRGTRTITAPTSLESTIASAFASEARKTIEGVVTALTAAWNRHDLVAMGALYREDADFVNIFGGYLVGRDEITREHVERHRVMFANATMETTQTTIRSLSPKVALVRVGWTMRGIRGRDGAPTGDRQGLMLHVMERESDGWWIATTQNTEQSPHAPQRFLDLAQPRRVNEVPRVMRPHASRGGT